MSSTWARYIGATVLLSVLGYNTALTVPGDCIATMWCLVADRTISTTGAAWGSKRCNPYMHVTHTQQLSVVAETVYVMQHVLQVPNLFAKDEVMTIIEAVTPKAKRAGRGISPPEEYAYFVLAMSPVGDAFRSVSTHRHVWSVTPE